MPIDLAKAVSGGGGLLRRRIMTQSQPFIAPIDGAYTITAIGGGGGGAGRFSGCATGGGGGGFVRKRVSLSAGASLTCVIGAGGAQSALASSTSQTAPGFNGGDTTVAGPGVNIVAGGGQGGNAAANGSAAAGAAGGTASGGDINYPGNGSGSSVWSSSATGGGSVRLHGIEVSSGSVTGGSGCATGGAGTVFSSDSLASSGKTDGGGNGVGRILPDSWAGDLFTGAGVSTVTGFNQIGTGGGGSTNTSNGAGQIFAGGGASSSTVSVVAGAGGSFGGGGGGCATSATTGNTARGGAGGDGLVVIEWLEG